jgi:hypothetical protein
LSWFAIVNQDWGLGGKDALERAHQVAERRTKREKVAVVELLVVVQTAAL